MERGNISVQTENIFPIIKKFLYSDQEIFLRELISNAIDASQKLKMLNGAGEFTGSVEQLRIQVILDKEAKTITIRDSGIGLTEEEAKKYLNQVAFSSAEEFIQKYKGEQTIIGHFGLGFYSAFMVAQKVDVISKSWKDSPAIKWSCDGSPEFTLENVEKQDRGTDVVLHVSDDASEYLDNHKIESLIKKYCKFLPVEIQFGTKTESTFEGEGEDRKEIKTEVDNILNNTDPAWKKNPNQLTDDDYKDFYQELYPYAHDPMFWIHLNIDYPFNLTGILYFPKVQRNMEIQKNKIQLYSNQVFVTEDIKDIVPEFLTLLHGVIDSPDIPLNVSRSALQADQQVKKITNYITKKVADKLAGLFDSDRKDFESKWEDMGVFVKYGMLTDEKFEEKAHRFCLMKNLEGEHFTIDEYKEKIKANQTDKHQKVVALYSDQKDGYASYVQAAKDKGYDILELDPMIDMHFIQHLEYKKNELHFVRIDSNTIDLLIEKDQVSESVLSTADQEKIKKEFESELHVSNFSKINMRALSPEDQAVYLVMPEFLRRMADMNRMNPMGMDNSFMKHELVINSNHPIIANKLLAETDSNKKSDTIRMLYELALLNQNMLKGDDLTRFTTRILTHMNKD